MLERLIIQNFQPHKKLEIDLSNLITVLVGPNDVGKSAVIRALRWVCLNEAPADFIRHGAQSAKVRIFFDSRSITRKRDSENQYIIGDEVFSAVRNTLPEAVVGLLGVNDLNFQDQHDSPFWFSETAGEISKQLNKIVNLDVIDRTLANLSSELRHSKTVVQVSEERLANAREARDRVKFVEELDQALSKIEAKQGDLYYIRAYAEELRFLITQAQNLKDTVRNLRQAVIDGQKLVSNGEMAFEVRKRAENLRQLLQQHQNLKDELVSIHNSLQEIQEQLAQVRTCPLCHQPIES